MSRFSVEKQTKNNNDKKRQCSRKKGKSTLQANAFQQKNKTKTKQHLPREREIEHYNVMVFNRKMFAERGGNVHYSAIGFKRKKRGKREKNNIVCQEDTYNIQT